MKLVINYDLLEKINSANGVLNLQKIMLNEMKTQAIMYGMFTGIDLISLRDDGIHWGTNLMICSAWFASKVALTALVEHKFKDRIAFAAYLELVKLTLQLRDLNVSTSPELLKGSKLITKEYILTHEKFRPTIQQNKYILVPTYDRLGDIKDASILQEHEMGSKQYTLSLGRPIKSFKLAHAYN